MADAHIFDKKTPQFLEGFYDMDERPQSLQQALGNLEGTTEVINRITTIMRAANFDDGECSAILDEYYAGDMSEPDATPSEDDNYYYVVTMPELRDIEFALEVLGEAATSVRQRVDKLKRELWQLLPDFYNGHANPMPQPLTYDPENPYPYSCIEGSLVKARKTKLWAWRSGLEYSDTYAQYMPDDSAPLTAIGFNEGNVEIDGKTAPTDIHWTEMRPFDDMLSFAEDVISNHDPTLLMIDPEGPNVVFCTDKARSAQNVKLVIYWNSEGTIQKEKMTIVLSALLNRRQLAQSFMTACEEAVKNYTSTAQENASLGYGDVSDDQLNYARNWERKVERLRSIV